MKIYILIVCAGLIVSGCGPALTGNQYSVEMPELPSAWVSILGEARWKIEWVSPQGDKEAAVAESGEKPIISLPQSWSSAVIAWPFWEDKGIVPGIFKPAGAIFPFDALDGNVALSWRGGLDAALYWELVKAAGQDTGSQRAVERLPWNFNWPRFRELFNDSSLNADFRADPWLADWPSIAGKIVASGFDKRRLVPQEREKMSIPVGPGPWTAVSPFALPLRFEGPPLFPVRQSADTWVSAEGLLRCNSEAWILTEW